VFHTFNTAQTPIASQILPPLNTVKQIYSSFAEGELDRFLELCSEEIEWVVNGPATLTKCQTFRGRSGVGEFLDILGDSWMLHSFTPRQFIESGSTVVVLGEETGVDEMSGEPFENRWVHVFDVQQQQIIRFREFLCHWASKQQPPVMSW
jgi:uncharacterized protein